MFTLRYHHRRRHGYGHNCARRSRPRSPVACHFRHRRDNDVITNRLNRFITCFRYGPTIRRPRPWERDSAILPKPEQEQPELPVDVDVTPATPATPAAPDTPATPDTGPEDPDTPEAPEAPEEELAKILHVKMVDLHIPFNTTAHRTDKYDIAQSHEDETTGTIVEPELVVRRGQDIKLIIEFDRPYHKEKNNLELVFKTGKNPRPSTKTLISLEVDESGEANENPFQWHARLGSKHENRLEIVVYSAANAVIGEWEFSVKTSERTDASEIIEKLRYEHPDAIYLLLNPWCKDDDCHMPMVKLLDEYVLNDSGAIYKGNSYQLAAKPWNFGQFEEGILDAALHLLRKAFGGNSSIAMCDTIQIARAFSKLAASTRKVGESVEVTMYFTNPLPIALTGCNLDVEGPGIESFMGQKQNDVPSKAQFRAKVTLKPKKAGDTTIIANFDAKELSDITGFKNIKITM